MKKLTIILLFVSMCAMAQVNVPNPYTDMYGATKLNFQVAVDGLTIGGIAAYSLINIDKVTTEQSLKMSGAAIGIFIISEIIQKRIDNNKGYLKPFKKRKRFKNFRIVLK